MSPKKILVIEDDPDVGMVIGTILRTAGYDVITAQDAVMAMGTARQHNPDCITLDIGMPGGGGGVVLERLRSNSFTALTPVIVITGSALIEREELMSQGAHAYLQKPFEPQELLKLVDALVGSEHN